MEEVAVAATEAAEMAEEAATATADKPGTPWAACGGQALLRPLPLPPLCRPPDLLRRLSMKEHCGDIE